MKTSNSSRVSWNMKSGGKPWRQRRAAEKQTLNPPSPRTRGTTARQALNAESFREQAAQRSTSNAQRSTFNAQRSTPNVQLRKLSRAGSSTPKLEVRRKAAFHVRLGASVVVTDRMQRRCRGPSRGARLQRHRAAAGWIEIFPAARARGATIPGLRRCCTE